MVESITDAEPGRDAAGLDAIDEIIQLGYWNSNAESVLSDALARLSITYVARMQRVPQHN